MRGTKGLTLFKFITVVAILGKGETFSEIQR